MLRNSARHSGMQTGDVVTFEDLMSGRGDALLRLATLLCESSEAQALVDQAYRRVDASDRADAQDELRAWVVRGYLSLDFDLALGAAADLHDMRLPPENSDELDDLMTRFLAVSKLGRAVLILRYRERLTDAAIARTVGSTEDGIATYTGVVLASLRVHPDRSTDRAVSGAYSEAHLRSLICDLDRELDEKAQAERRTFQGQRLRLAATRRTAAKWVRPFTRSAPRSGEPLAEGPAETSTGHPGGLRTR